MAARRRRQNAEAKQRQRAAAAEMGARAITIVLDADSAALVATCLDRRAPGQGADARIIRAAELARMLVVGAKMLANAGVPRGHKVRGNGNTAEQPTAIADVSAIAQ